MSAQASTLFGVFAWHQDPRYRKEEAVKLYKRRSAAEKFADALTDEPERYDLPRRERGYVCRPVDA